MRFLVIAMVVLFSSGAMAQKCPVDVSSFCFEEIIREGQSYNASVTFCRDLSNTCYMGSRFDGNSFKESKTLCQNVSNNCFTEVSNYHSNQVSAKACSNVNNKCFTQLRILGRSIQESIFGCEDVRMECRICDLLQLN
jgi:hypothetical protein